MKNQYIKDASLINNLSRLLCLLAAFVICAVSVLVYRASLVGLLLLVLFCITYIQIPGLYIIRKAGLHEKHISTFLSFGLFTGWCFQILIYFLNDLLPSDILLYISGPLISFLYLLRLIRDTDYHSVFKEINISKLSPAFCIFAVLVLFYCSAGVQYNYMSPSVADFTIMNSDKAYHIGLINSLSHDYPMQSPWVSGRYITYHIFSEIILSIPVRLFSAPADFMMLSFGPLWTALVISLSVYCFYREMSSVPKRAGVYSLLLMLSNIYITRDANTSLAFKFALENDNSSGYGVAATLISLVAFKKWYESFKANSPEKWKYFALFTAFIMLTTGIKGPMGAVIIASALGTILLGVVLRKVSPKALVPVLVSSAGFVFVYKTVLNGRGTQNATGESIFAFAKIADIAFWKKPLVETLKAMGLSTGMRLGIVMLVFLVFFFTIYFLPFCIGYIREVFLVISGKKPYEPYRVIVYAACAVGFLLMMVMNYAGHSQVYFGLVTVFLAPMVALWFIEDLERNRDSSKASKVLLRIVVSVMSISMIITSATLADYMMERIDGAISGANINRTPNKYMSISNEEYKAMIWLSENTEKDALLATDRYYSVSPEKYNVENRWDNRFFLYSDYSNRFTYISGSGYNIPDSDYELRKEMIDTNKKLYDVTNEKRGDLARELGVDYVVVSKRFTEVEDLSNKDYKKCYSNNEIDIYEIAG